MANAEILAGVKECFASALGIDESKVVLETSFADLDIESIDVLDVIFRLDTKFGITTSMKELQRRLLGDLTEEEFFDEDRVVTEAGLKQLQRVVPGFDPTGVGDELREEQIFPLFTVGHLVEVIEEKLAQGTREG